MEPVESISAIDFAKKKLFRREQLRETCLSAFCQMMYLSSILSIILRVYANIL